MSTYRKTLMDIINKYYLPYTVVSKPIIWASAFVPSEILKAWDVDVIYPESHSAILSSRLLGQELIRESQSYGLDESVCSYMRLLFVALEKKVTKPFGEIPKPDALVVTNNQCGTLYYMWKIFARRYDIPLYIIDFPPEIEGLSGEDYLASGMEGLIDFMEYITGKPLNPDSLSENIDVSKNSSNLWMKLCDLTFRGKTTLTPSSLANNLFFPIVCARTNPNTPKLYKSVLKQHGLNQVEKKCKKKIYWFGYPLWHLSEKFPDIGDFGANIVANNYLKWWNIPIVGDNPALCDLSKAYSGTFLNTSFRKRVSYLLEDIDEYGIDGVIVHSNLSCKRDSIVSQKITEELSDKGIPAMNIKADMCEKDYLPQ